MIHQRKILKAVAYAILLCFTSLTGAQPLYAIPANTQLPVVDTNFTPIGANVPNEVTGNTMNIQQTDKTSIIKWQDFSIGADAAVNFNYNGEGGFNSLNYVTGANAPISEIYGQLTALGGNIFIANPAGVQIGNSAQINVGSLYVTNKDVGEAVEYLGKNSKTDEIVSAIREHGVAETNAELMSLGAITNATNVTFDGARIVLDTDRIYTANETTGELEQVNGDWFETGLDIITTDKDNVVLGYTKDNPRGVAFDNFGIKVVGNNGNVEDDKLSHGYMWVHNLNELRAMNDDPNGWYALRNSIDANDTASIDDDKGFDPIGDSSQAFTGRFDGLGYSIFGLNINNSTTDNVGLFGYAQNATIRNFTLNSSEIKGGANTGAAVGHADGGKIENVTNTGNVTGGDGTGGIVGKAENKVAMSGLINIGKVTGGVGTGGVVGSMSGGTLGGDTYNLGSVTGTSSVGGIVGSVTNATIGNEVTQDNPDAFQIFNQLNVTGNYNVGGIAGTMSGGKITNTANHGNVTAVGKTTDNYSYHTAVVDDDNLDGATLEGTLATIEVAAANAGGIAGETKDDATISNVLNDGDVTSVREGDDNHYKAGNVGGIVGRAKDTTITNAENKENTVAGAHNVGGVAGFLGGDSTDDIGVNNSVNNGGDITATGARKFNAKANDTNGYVKERVRPYAAEEDEAFNVGNIGGIVGYLYGDKAKVKNSGNRGTVHSANIDNVDNVPETAKAANVGGVVGKIDTPEATTLSDIKADAKNGYAGGLPTVLNSYSTGNVRGYTGVGGVVGMMYNGSVAGSYNLGTVQSSRAVSGGREPLNMGGVVGDTTEKSNASAVLYDVYNAGKIGDDTYQFYGRHVGGVVGRLSGELEKAYNTGDIYNGYGTVGGIVGWWAAGNIKNVFSTGNITVVNNDNENGVSQVGGIAGAHSGADSTLSYAYNLGTIRSFTPYGLKTTGDKGRLSNAVGGIIGYARKYQGTGLKIENVYTTNNIYAATDENNNGIYENTESVTDGVGAIYGRGDYTLNDISSAYYVKMYEDSFADLSRTAGVTDTVTKDADGNFAENAFNGFTFNNQTDRNSVNDDEDGWRIYNGTTPILNAFLPNSEGYFSGKDLGGLNIDSVQYGTAANPLLTIINAKGNGSETVTLDWKTLGSSGNASFAVYNGGLTLNSFGTETGYYRGTIYADGALNVKGTADRNFNLGSSANLYGTSVKLDAKGDATIYGNVTSTNGDISISGGDIEILGKLASSKKGDEAVSVKNIAKKMTVADDAFFKLKDPKAAVSTVSDAYAHTPNVGDVKDGNITVNASGAAEVLYGNLGTGSVSTAGNFTVNGGTTDGGSVYVDSDLSGTTGNINLSAGGEVLLDITNIAKANSNGEGDNGKDALHTFLGNYDKSKGNHKEITLSSENDDEIIAIDMWNDGTDTGSFALDKYNLANDKTLIDAFKSLNLGNELSAEDIVHIWISDANQLKGIQSYAETNGGSGILGYNFALKGNIDASELEGYKAIGGDEAYSGTFDGRDFRIIGLNADATKADEASSGIFGKLAGTVKDLRVYASKFFGGDGESAGAIASEVITQTKEDGSTVSGTITGVTTFGNKVTAEDGAAGGIAGTNAGKIESSAASDSVITNGGTAGGIAGTNTGTIGAMEGTFVTAESAVTSNGNATAIGGVVGDNKGTVNLANSLGVTNGANVDKNIGGIAGDNSGTMYSLYNESVVTGNGSVGGVAGTNSGNITNAVNTTGITATGDYAGGLAGVNSGTIDSGRNTGTINGKDNVGGMVGKNEEKADGTGGILKNLSNAVTAAIFGSANVGGIAGTNSGTITSDNNLVNEGTVYGNQNVGGIAGVNEQDGVIQNVTSETLVLKTSGGDDAKYFGGIAGQNKGIITDATNESNVRAEGAEFVGGIAGKNTETGWLTGSLVNNGDVTGRSNVGGLAGVNNNSSLLKGGADNPLRVTNNGTITATNGGAGGIFHTNTGDIEHAVLTNNGAIIATGENANTGGLFGENSGNASFSSLINTGKVSGGANTGGLIGYNTGTLTGGRGTGANGMTLYKYQIYNNGAVSGGDNTGGLIGTNDTNGMLYAAYNTGTVTGAVYKDDGTVDHYTNNIGGIVGKNAGTVSSVFNTIMTATGENQSVTGASNVGGLIGSNIGTLKDAYNTTAVETTSNGETKGNAVGENSGTVGNVYATNTDGKLIGNNTSDKVSNVYSFSTGDMSAKVIDTEEDRKQSISYNDFAFGSTWKNYDGWSLPMLSVFLTKATYTDISDLTYNATNQSATGSFTAADGLIANISTGGQLLLNTENKNANSYLAYYSGQIAASGTGEGFDPNNLGYDINNNSYTIKKAQLDMVLNDINRTYGDATMYDSDGKQTNYGFTFGDNGTVLNDAMREELKNIKFTQETDGAVDGVDKSREQKTNNAGTYKWTADFTLGNLADNYEFIGEGAGDDGTTFSGSGKSEVRRADLTVTLDNVERIYGDLDILNGVYQIKDANLVNGDSGLKLNYDVVFTDNGLTDDRTRTNDAGEHKWLVGTDALVGVDNLSQNYIINIVPGQSTVKPRELTISDIVAKIVYGDQGSKGWEITGGTLGNIAYNDDVQLSTELTENNAIFSQAYLNDKGNRTTADVGIYKDGISYNLSLKGDKAGNYTIADAVSGTVEVIKAALTFIVGDASTTYGTDFDESKYGYTLSGMANEDSQESLSALIGDVQYENSAAFDDPNGRRTADAGRHKDAISITSGVNLKNYSVAFENGDAVIDKASLTVNANDASAVYGSASWNYGYKLDGLANGDTAEGLSEELSGIKYDNTAAFDGTNGRYTADAGIHEDAISVNLTGVDLKNYEVVAGNKGTAAVTPAKLTITADDQSVLLGTRPEYTGTAPADLGNQLVNGDSLHGFSYIFGIADTGLETEIGRHEGVIGLFAGGHFYGGGTHDLSTLSSVFRNYDVTVDAGTLTVSAGDNFGHLHWLHRGGERVRNFRERKAEIYFHEGGMVHEEAL